MVARFDGDNLRTGTLERLRNLPSGGKERPLRDSIYSFNKDFLSLYYVRGLMQYVGNTVLSKTDTARALVMRPLLKPVYLGNTSCSKSLSQPHEM